MGEWLKWCPPLEQLPRRLVGLKEMHMCILKMLDIVTCGDILHNMSMHSPALLSQALYEARFLTQYLSCEGNNPVTLGG